MTALLSRLPDPAPLVNTLAHGCWDCPAWRRKASAIGICDSKTSTHRGDLSSYVYICPHHPKFGETP